MLIYRSQIISEFYPLIASKWRFSIKDRSAINMIRSNFRDLLITWKQGYPQLGYMQRVWCLHTRCIELVDHLPMPKLYLLLDLVESNFLSRRNPPRSRYGSFYAQPIQQEEPMLTPTPTVAPAGQLTKNI